MEKYVKLKDVKEMLKKLWTEPAYQHEDEDFFCGVHAVDGEIDFLPTIEIKEPGVTAVWRRKFVGFLSSDYVCSNCESPAEEGNTGHHDYLTLYCNHCGAKMVNVEVC